MIFIRDALICDLDGLTVCANNFFQYAEFHQYGWYLDDDDFKALMTEHIENPNGIVLCLMDGLKVVGGIASGIAPFIYNRSKKIALELYFWVEPEYRGIKTIKMFKQYEQRLRDMGVCWSMMTLPETFMGPKIKSFYEKMGYVKSGTTFVKIL